MSTITCLKSHFVYDQNARFYIEGWWWGKVKDFNLLTTTWLHLLSLCYTVSMFLHLISFSFAFFTTTPAPKWKAGAKRNSVKCLLTGSKYDVEKRKRFCVSLGPCGLETKQCRNGIGMAMSASKNPHILFWTYILCFCFYFTGNKP